MVTSCTVLGHVEVVELRVQLDDQLRALTFDKVDLRAMLPKLIVNRRNDSSLPEVY